MPNSHLTLSPELAACVVLQEGQADTFLMNQLPFEADIRMASFAAFTEKHFKLPHRGQTAAMDAAIDAMMLADGEISC